jgi:hypothetical protein
MRASRSVNYFKSRGEDRAYANTGSPSFVRFAIARALFLNQYPAYRLLARRRNEEFGKPGRERQGLDMRRILPVFTTSNALPGMFLS